MLPLPFRPQCKAARVAFISAKKNNIPIDHLYSLYSRKIEVLSSSYAQTRMCILFAGSNGYVDGWLHQHTVIVFLLAMGSVFSNIGQSLDFSPAQS